MSRYQIKGIWKGERCPREEEREKTGEMEKEREEGERKRW